MNFWDSTVGGPVAGTATPPLDAAARPQQSLNEEVTEVMGQLNKFWGGFRKQSQDALLAARKDLGQYATQAQKDLEQYASQAQKELNKLGIIPETSPAVAPDAESSNPPDTDASSSISSSASTLPGPSSPSNTSPTSPTTTLFSRLQAALPPDLLHTLQTNLPDSIRHAPERLDLAQLRGALQQVRVQDATVRGEELLRTAGDFLRDAVRVVPPGEAPSAADRILNTAGTNSNKGKQRQASEAQAIGTRKEALLRALRSNAAILKVDPASEMNSEALFKTWEDKEVAGAEGGMLGEVWKKRTEDELVDAGEDLAATRDALVPSEVAEDVFWTRYFFRVYQIEQEEERRKALLAGSARNDEDFSWEDEEEEAASPTSTLQDRRTSSPTDTLTAPTIPAKPPSRVATPGTTSPSQSEGSYDIVSEQVSNAGENTPQGRARGKREEDDDDNDDDNDDDDEGEDESGESDWE